jgi:hypothetical protein
MYVIPKDGCPSSLYVELSILDSAGNAIGFTNDTAGAVIAGQQAKMVFDSLESGAVKARLTDVSCFEWTRVTRHAVPEAHLPGVARSDSPAPAKRYLGSTCHQDCSAPKTPMCPEQRPDGSSR